MSTTTTLPRLRWLHLTDLHVGRNCEAQRVAFASMLKAIGSNEHVEPFDFVIMTGDLAYSGSEEEFTNLEQILIGPLRAHHLFKNSIFLAVPGNHDMDCAVGIPPTWNAIGAARQETFFNHDQEGKKVRSGRAGAFESYSQFVERVGIVSVNPLTEPARLYRTEVKGRKLAFVLTVTSFFSDRYVSDKNKAPMPTHAVRAVLQDVKSDELAIILGHHPSSWFLMDSDRHFQSLLIENKALYLHGHEHIVMAKFNGRGLSSLGFGASYQASLQASPSVYYRNSFAICELDTNLHIAITSWDAENGLWRPDSQLPGDFLLASPILPNAHQLTLSAIFDQSEKGAPFSQIASAVRADVKIEGCIWLAEDDTTRWTALLVQNGTLTRGAQAYALPRQMLPIGHVQFRVKDSRGHYLVRGISANGDVLNYEQLQKINTELDTQDYDGCFVVTMGSLAKDAQTLAAQLASRKSITVLDREEIVRGAVRAFSASQKTTLNSVESGKVAVSLIVTNSGVALIFEDNTKHHWFSVFDEAGEYVAESAALVYKLREASPHLQRLTYQKPDSLDAVTSEFVAISFDTDEYLRKNREYFDDVRYAPLAALGIRFNKMSLSEMYVTASADVGGSTKTSQNATRALTEFVDSLPISKAQKEQIEAQMRARYGLERTAEVGAASQLYQRYNNVVVLGDPGSGKTCFVKHEILSYCTRSYDDGSWYASHFPVYISLAEAAKLHGEDCDILEICQIQSSRREIELSRTELESWLAAGKAAFFFDGLDEVGYIDARISLMSEIGKLVKKYAPKGNRFVIASRPAAVQPVDVPEEFTYVQLKGLTEDEMRVLAGRVMSARVGDGESDNLERDQNQLIERLLEDTRSSPGIARIARNPLLLTLLVLIYANTGAVSAKRHVIYTQAIKTLVSVRGRDIREHQISEADLRTRLGAVASAIFNRTIDEIPKRSEVISVLSSVMHQPSSPFAASKAKRINDFLQEVAEATGLISLHSNEIPSPDDLVTFMHFSFLEYYAAAGILASDYDDVLKRLSRNPRWRDVTTLMFGILSDYKDVTSALGTLLHDDSPAGKITSYKLLLGLDCAAECDVPPEGTQVLLAETIFQTVSKGAARYSADLRQEIANKMQYFLQGAGPRLEDSIIRGLKSEDPIIVAAFCDLVSSFDEGIVLPQTIAQAFTSSLKTRHSAARAAAMQAIEKHPDLRTEHAERIVAESLSGNVSEKHAALKVISAVPEYHSKMANKIKSLLDDTNLLVSELAASNMLVHGLRGGSWKNEEAVREKVLAKINQSEQDSGISLAGVTLHRESIESMVVDGDEASRELAIRYAPLITDDPQYVYRLLSKTIRQETNSRTKAACMDSFRTCSGAIDLFSIADTDFVCDLLEHKERNVRLSAIKLLGELPDDEQVVRSLKGMMNNLAKEKSRDQETTEVARALAKHVRRNPKLREDVLSIILQHLPANVSDGFGDEARQHHIRSLLLVCESIGGVAESTALQALRFAEDFRTPEKIRRQAIRVFGRLCEPSHANVKTFCVLLNKNDLRLREAIYPSATAFIKRCRGKVEYVRRVYGSLEKLREELCSAWTREVASSVESIDPSAPRDIREAVIEIENLTAAYEEFSERAKVAKIA